jgi:uncharacterized protein (TIGR02145 family)
MRIALTVLAFIFGSMAYPQVPDALSISLEGDTLHLESGGFMIITGISAANYGGSVDEVGTTLHTCGAANLHNPNKNYGSLIDQEGNVYKTIVIGTQEWMAENLKTSVYRNGEPIPTLFDGISWAASVEGARSYYNEEPSYACPYGQLYNWYACVDDRHLCPTGWHVPLDSEWWALITFLDPNADSLNLFPNKAGDMLKSNAENASLWHTSTTATHNTSGFSGVLGGGRYIDGEFGGFGIQTLWWSCTEDDEYSAWMHSVDKNLNSTSRWYQPKNYGLAVRCIRD